MRWPTTPPCGIWRSSARQRRAFPEEIRQRHPDVDWRGLAGLRDVLAHAYFALDDPTLWKIVQVDIPRVIELLGPIEQELP